MKIGLDYGGVISFDPDRWGAAIRQAMSWGHEIFLISHAQPGEDMERRSEFCRNTGAKNLSFSDLRSGEQEGQIAKRKAELCNEHGIEIFIDDDLHRVRAVGEGCPNTAAFYIPQSVWQIGLRIINDLDAGPS